MLANQAALWALTRSCVIGVFQTLSAGNIGHLDAPGTVVVTFVVAPALSAGTIVRQLAAAPNSDVTTASRRRLEAEVIIGENDRTSRPMVNHTTTWLRRAHRPRSLYTLGR